MIFFEDAIFLDQPVPHKIKKQPQKVTFKTKLMEAFPNNPNVDGWGARKCKLQFAGPRIPMSMVTAYLTYSSLGMHNKDAHNSVTWTPSTWCLNTKHVMGWDENANPLSGQSKCLESRLFMLFQHFSGYIWLLYYAILC